MRGHVRARGVMHKSPDILLVAGDDVHSHEHVECVVNAPPDVLLVEGYRGVQLEFFHKLVCHLRIHGRRKRGCNRILNIRRAK